MHEWIQVSFPQLFSGGFFMASKLVADSSTYWTRTHALTTEPQGQTGTFKLPNSYLVSNGGTEYLSLTPLGHWAWLSSSKFEKQGDVLVESHFDVTIAYWKT